MHTVFGEPIWLAVPVLFERLHFPSPYEQRFLSDSKHPEPFDESVPLNDQKNLSSTPGDIPKIKPVSLYRIP